MFISIRIEVRSKPGFYLLPGIVAGLLLCCAPQIALSIDAPAEGPRTQMVDFSAYQVIRYVDQSAGSDQTGDGSQSRPWQTLNHALAQTDDAVPEHRYALLVAQGTYAGSTLQLQSNVDMYGGFASGNWQRDIFAHPVIHNTDLRADFRAQGGTNYLWLLSRTPDVSDELLARFTTWAGELGFDTEKLVYVVHEKDT